MMKKQLYKAPCVEVLSVKIERGFAISGENTYAGNGEPGMLEEGGTFTW